MIKEIVNIEKKIAMLSIERKAEQMSLINSILIIIILKYENKEIWKKLFLCKLLKDIKNNIIIKMIRKLFFLCVHRKINKLFMYYLFIFL